jgi:hypothetical protein
VPLNESGNNFNIRDFPKGATVQAITSKDLIGGKSNVSTLLWEQRPDCLFDPFYFDRFSVPNKYGKMYMCGNSEYSKDDIESPRACDVFSCGPINGNATRCFTVTVDDDLGSDRATLDKKNFTVNIYGALGPSSVSFEVLANKMRPWYWFHAFKFLAYYVLFDVELQYESCRIYLRGKNVFSKRWLLGGNLKLGYSNDGWTPASVLFNYDNGSMVRLDNDEPFTLMKDKSFSFLPSVGKHSITATLYSERDGKGASISHTRSFRVVRLGGDRCL